MPQEILDRHLTLGGLPRGLAVLVGDKHVHLGELRQELGHRISELHPAFLDQHHGGNRGQGFRHGIDAKDRILGHWLTGRLVLEADRFGIDQLASAGDHHNGAGHAIGFDLLLQYRPNAGEPVRRDIDRYGLCGR